MKRLNYGIFFVAFLLVSFSCFAKDGKHLFILSGQSNMQGLDISLSFVPALEKAFGKDKIIVVKSAFGGRAIGTWYKKWQPGKETNKDKPVTNPGTSYDSLINQVNSQIKGQKVKTVTFLWLQGETDALMNSGDVYGASLEGIFTQLTEDLKRQDINYVIGRISDTRKNHKHWTMVRKVQVELAEKLPRADWVNTDDLNDGLNSNGKLIKNDMHYSVEGYKILGQRLADKAINLINKK
ncbi:MAG: sialate O-acetylesterase [Lentisphaeraceae bacterium]|nr:sialate O-acetylesterase [Lentisphaeraceae bacterium]